MKLPSEYRSVVERRNGCSRGSGSPLRPALAAAPPPRGRVPPGTASASRAATRSSRHRSRRRQGTAPRGRGRTGRRREARRRPARPRAAPPARRRPPAAGRAGTTERRAPAWPAQKNEVPPPRANADGDDRGERRVAGHDGQTECPDCGGPHPVGARSSALRGSSGLPPPRRQREDRQRQQPREGDEPGVGRRAAEREHEQRVGERRRRRAGRRQQLPRLEQDEVAVPAERGHGRIFASPAARPAAAVRFGRTSGQS